MLGLIGSLVILCQATAARAETDCERSRSTLCSRTFYATGHCDGTDNLAGLTPDASAPIKLVRSWERHPLTIVGAEVTMFQQPKRLSYAYIGNGHTPNHMLFLGPGEAHSKQFFPPGIGFALPPAEAPGNAYIDLHVSCAPQAGEVAYQAFMTIYYTLDVVRLTEGR